MKKTLLVSAMIAMSMVMMFVSCKKEENTFTGCTCEYYDPSDGESWTVNFSADEMKKNYGVSDCGALSSAVKSDSYGGDFSVRCHE